MNGRQMLFDVMNEIDDDLIVFEEEYLPVKKHIHSSCLFVRVFAVVCVTLSILIIGNVFLKKMNKKYETHSSSSEDMSSSEEKENSEQSYLDLEKVLFCPSEELVIVDEIESNPGEINMVINLKSEIMKQENKDKFFSVTIVINHFDFIEQYRQKMYTERMDAFNDPILVKYRDDYELWVETIVKPTISKEEMENFEEKWYHSLQSYAEFDEYWREQQSNDVWEAYLDAKAIDQQAYDAFVEYEMHEHDILEELFAKNIEDEMTNELNRLKAEGYILEIQSTKEKTYTGYLTGEQLQTFSCSENHGYYIFWNDFEGGMDE